MVVAGQRRRLVVCVVSDLAPGSGHAVWISDGNGSALQSFAYGASQEDGGTVCTVSFLPEDPPAGGDLACHVGPNTTSPAHSSSPIRITGMAPPPPPPPLPALLAAAQPGAPVSPEDGDRRGLPGRQGAGARPRGPALLLQPAGAGRGLWPAPPRTWCQAATTACPAALSSHRQ